MTPVPEKQSQQQPKQPPGLDRFLLDILVCPLTHAPLRYDKENNELISLQAGLAYPIKDGVPVMLPAEARKLTDGEQAAWRKKPPPPE